MSCICGHVCVCNKLGLSEAEDKLLVAYEAQLRQTRAHLMSLVSETANDPISRQHQKQIAEITFILGET